MYPCFIRPLPAFHTENSLWELMKKSHNKGIWRRLVTVVLLPLIIPFLIFGWVLYFMGSQRKWPKSAQKRQLVQQEIIIEEKGKQESVQPQILA